MRLWAEAMAALDIIGQHAVYADFEREALARRPEVLLAEFPSLRGEVAARLRKLAHRGAIRRTVVVYGFAAIPVEDALAGLLRDEGIEVGEASRHPAVAESGVGNRGGGLRRRPSGTLVALLNRPVPFL
jgi:hypothetical protein